MADGRAWAHMQRASRQQTNSTARSRRGSMEEAETQMVLTAALARHWLHDACGRTADWRQAPSPAYRGTAPEELEARRVAAPKLCSIMSLARGRQARQGKAAQGARSQGPWTVANKQASRGPSTGGNNGDVWADLRPLRCMYSEHACRCLQQQQMAAMLCAAIHDG
jgi:hypothetical protein